MPVWTIVNYSKNSISVSLSSRFKKKKEEVDISCLKLAAAQHDDVPMNHGHLKALSLSSRLRTQLGSARFWKDQEQRDVSTQTDYDKMFYVQAEGLTMLQILFSNHPHTQTAQ